MRPLAAGALYWEDERTLLVADLHLEKGAAFAALGMLLPPYDTRATLDRLTRVIDAVRAFARGGARRQLPSQPTPPRVFTAEDLDTLLALQQGARMVLDLRQSRSASARQHRRHGLRHAHHSRAHAPARAVACAVAREIAGHLHPVARIARRGTVIRRRCFATDGNRLVMPAFGAYAGGLNLRDEAFAPLFHRHRLEAWMMGRANVYPVLGSLLLPD